MRDFYAMAEQGLFENERVELIEGVAIGIEFRRVGLRRGGHETSSRRATGDLRVCFIGYAWA